MLLPAQPRAAWSLREVRLHRCILWATSLLCWYEKGGLCGERMAEDVSCVSCVYCMCLVQEPVWPRMYAPAPGSSSQVVKLGAALPQQRRRLQRSQTQLEPNHSLGCGGLIFPLLPEMREV